MIEVTIGGCESSYFAGEQVELTITFTNTNTRPSSNSTATAPVSPHPPRSPASHRRGTHSISSAPLPRPPTSPGMRQSFHTHNQPSLSTSDLPRTRRGLIGFTPAPSHSLHHVQRNPPFSPTVSRTKRLANGLSLSVNLSPSQLGDLPSNSCAPSPSTPDACAYVRPSFRPLNAR